MTTTKPEQKVIVAQVVKSRARRIGRGMYDAVIGNPVRGGHLRLDAVPRLERHLTILGLVLLVGLLAALLLGDQLRAGAMTNITTESDGRSSFIPLSLLPVTLLGLLIAWAMILWGAVMATPPVTLGAAVAFLLANATLGKPLTIATAGGWVLTHGPTVMRAAYFAVPALMVLYTIAELKEPLARKLKVVVLPLLVLSLLTFFGMPLWLHITNTARGLEGSIPFLVHAAAVNSQRLLIPAILVSFMGIIGFSGGVARALATPLFETSIKVAKWVALGVILFKLWIQVGRDPDVFSELGDLRPITIVRLLLSGVLFVVAARFASRLARRGRNADDMKDRLVFGAAVAYALPMLITLCVLMAAEFIGTQFSARDVYKITDAFPSTAVSEHGNLVVWALVLGVGIRLLATRHERKREAGFALTLMSAWILPPYIVGALNIQMGFRYGIFDVMLTLGLLGWLLARWKSVDRGAAAGVMALTLFSWIVLTQGDFLPIIGGWVGLPAVVIVVVGVLWTLLSDSSFASRDSRHFPMAARPLIWVGYLLLSVTLLVWVRTTHVFDIASPTAENGFFYLGIPLAAWLAIRDPFSDPPQEERAEALALEADVEQGILEEAALLAREDPSVGAISDVEAARRQALESAEAAARAAADAAVAPDAFDPDAPR